MEGSPNIYNSGYPRTEAWKLEDDSLSKETVGLDTFAVFPRQLHVPQKDLTSTAPIDLTKCLSDESGQIPPPFVREFLEKIKEQFFFYHGSKISVEQVDLLGKTVVNTAMDFYTAVAGSLRKFRDSLQFSGSDLTGIYPNADGSKKLDFPHEFKRHLCKLAEANEQSDRLQAIMEISFEASALSHGFVQNNRFILDTACKKEFSFFSKQGITIPLLCSHLENCKDTLEIVDLTNYDLSNQLRSKNLEILLSSIKELSKMEILNLEGICLDSAHAQILLEIMSNPSLKHVRLTRQCLSEECVNGIEKNKPNHVKIHLYQDLPKRQVLTESQGNYLNPIGF